MMSDNFPRAQQATALTVSGLVSLGFTDKD